MNVMNPNLTKQQYKALHDAQQLGVRFDCYLLAPGERLWKEDLPIINDSKLPNQMPDSLMNYSQHSIIRERPVMCSAEHITPLQRNHFNGAEVNPDLDGTRTLTLTK